ncbi:MAG TPA: hypothetical protein PLD91_15260 [Spirochaetota bacterium]|nr:hypothetical protein [Spirochaetota bacterium]
MLVIGGGALSALELGVFVSFMTLGITNNYYPLAVVLFNCLMIPLIVLIKRRSGPRRVKRAAILWNAVALNVFAWITSRLIFVFRLRSFMDKGMIQRKNIELESEKKNLEGALAKVKRLSGPLPICANCNKVRDDRGYWQQVEEYVAERSEAAFSHSLCPECMKKLYPDLDR